MCRKLIFQHPGRPRFAIWIKKQCMAVSVVEQLYRMCHHVGSYVFCEQLMPVCTSWCFFVVLLLVLLRVFPQGLLYMFLYGLLYGLLSISYLMF